MCGIAGFFNLKGNRDFLQQNIESMLSAIIHRGPDAHGTWMDTEHTGLTFGHRRLSIVDLSANGSQPMLSHNDRYVICYNGEIYNTSYVLEHMRADGYTDEMRGTSDTEVLLEALAFYGVNTAIKMCKGMFAIALYDRKEETLTFIRDRIGEKPLYYGFVGDAFVFASELGSITKIKGFDNSINTGILDTYLKYGYIPAPYSIYSDIYKLEAGCILQTKVKTGINKRAINDDLKIERYWSNIDVAVDGIQNQFAGTRQDAADELERLLTDSIRGQMVADVPLGAFLSAGIDSSTVVALMQSISDRPVRTFTIGFDNAEYNEAREAAEIAKHLGTEHTQLYVTKQDALDVIPVLSDMFGEPFADSSQIPTYLVSKMTREHVTVSLSGDGGDELFAGYRDYTGVQNIYKKIKGIPYPIRSIAGTVMEHAPLPDSLAKTIHPHGTLLKAKDPVDLYRRTYETDPLVGKLVKYRPVENKPDGMDINHKLVNKYDEFDPLLMGDDPVHTAMLMNLEMYHPDDILAKVDRTAMAVSLETRVPMLDPDVIRFAWSLPLNYVKDDSKGKLVLRDVLYRHVPEAMMDRPKKGFGVPIAMWLKEDGLREWSEDLLNPELIKAQGVLDSSIVSKVWNDYINKGVWRPQVWYLLMLQSFFINKLEMSK